MERRGYWTEQADGDVSPGDGQPADVSDLNIGSADFVASGDVLPLLAMGEMTNASSSTSSTSYTNMSGLFRTSFNFDVVNAANLDIVIRIIQFVSPGTDETAATAVFDNDAGTQIIEITGITTAGRKDSGWVAHSPTNPSNLRQLRAQGKTSAGVNPSTFEEMTFMVGVQL